MGNFKKHVENEMWCFSCTRTLDEYIPVHKATGEHLKCSITMYCPNCWVRKVAKSALLDWTPWSKPSTEILDYFMNNYTGCFICKYQFQSDDLMYEKLRQAVELEKMRNLVDRCTELTNDNARLLCENARLKDKINGMNERRTALRLQVEKQFDDMTDCEDED